jgi:hypothetical protein
MLYGILPFLVMALFDEVYSLWLIPVIITVTLIFAGGMYYLSRGRNRIAQ